MTVSRPRQRPRPKVTGETPHWDANRTLLVALFLCVSAALWNAFRIDKHLSADGVHYFTGILESAGFFHVDGTRRFAEYLTQWPLVVAVRAGVIGIPVLTATFAAGIFLPYLLSFLLCLYAVRGENSVVLALPLLSMVAVNLPADYVLVGEHHVMALLAPPILLLILRRTPPSWGDGLCLVLALFAFSRTYASAVLPALIFAALLAARSMADRSDRRANIVRAVALVLCVATIAIAGSSIVAPRDAANRDLFRRALFAILRQPEVAFLTAAVVSLLCGLAARARVARHLGVALATSSLILYAPYVLDETHGLTAIQSFATRTLTATLLPILLVLTVAVHRRSPAFTGFPRTLVVAILLTAVVGKVVQSAHWVRYRDEMRSVLATKTGYVAVEETRLLRNPCRWAWTSPQLSIVWSAPEVRSIVENQSVDAEAWQPFDPRQTLPLRRYVSYHEVFAGVRW